MNTARVMPWQQIGGSSEYGDLESNEKRANAGVSARGTWNFIDIPLPIPESRKVEKEVKFAAEALGELLITIVKSSTVEKKNPDNEAKLAKAIQEQRRAHAWNEGIDAAASRARYEEMVKTCLRITGKPSLDSRDTALIHQNTSFSTSNLRSVKDFYDVSTARSAQIAAMREERKPLIIPKGKTRGGPSHDTRLDAGPSGVANTGSNYSA